MAIQAHQLGFLRELADLMDRRCMTINPENIRDVCSPEAKGDKPAVPTVSSTSIRAAIAKYHTDRASEVSHD